MPEPFRIAREKVRVLRPAGRITIHTSYAGQCPPMRYAPNAAAGNIGLTMFDRNAFVNLSRLAGLVDVEQ